MAKGIDHIVWPVYPLKLWVMHFRELGLIFEHPDKLQLRHFFDLNQIPYAYIQSNGEEVAINPPLMPKARMVLQ